MSAPPREVRLAELMTSLSLATDLGMGQPLEQAMRYCLLALELGRRIGCDAKALSDVYYLALLEHIGCTATAPDMAPWNAGDEIALRSRGIALTHASTSEVLGVLVRLLGEGRPLPIRGRLVAAALAGGEKRYEPMIAIQCDGAARLADRLGMSPEVREGLNHFYERWDGKGAPHGRSGEEVSLAQRVVIVAHDAVVHARLEGAAAALDVIRKRRGAAYDPSVCDALLEDGESLVAGDPPDDAWMRVLDAEPEPRRVVGEDALEGLLRTFGDFTDLKTPFLMGHSTAVAELAAGAAEGLGTESQNTQAVRLAGLVHDVGRVGVPNGIWEKAGSLTVTERERVRLHPYYTERILAATTSLSGLAAHAAAHHERMDGSGYHRGLSPSQQPLEARILAAADVYDALTHERPHRRALDPEEARAELRTEVVDGLLDQRAVNAVLEAAGARPVRARDAWPAALSDREVEVLRLVARGKTNRQIAAALVISEKTVGRHVENLYAKAGLSTRAGAALFAAEHGLLD